MPDTAHSRLGARREDRWRGDRPPRARWAGQRIDRRPRRHNQGDRSGQALEDGSEGQPAVEEGREGLTCRRTLNLRADLMKKLGGISKQRLSDKVAQVKKAHGPMTTEDAVYLLAHQSDLDLPRYLDPETVDRVRGMLQMTAA